MRYQSYSEKGDRLLDWSYCGYGRSQVPLPDAPLRITLDPPDDPAKAADGRAYPVGKCSHGLIQGALDRVAKHPPDARGLRGAVRLGKGTWHLTKELRIPSGVVLRGDGDAETGTMLLVSHPQGGGNGLAVGTMGARIRPTGARKPVRISNAYLPTGSINLEVDSDHDFEQGDFVCVRKTVNQKWIDDLGVGERLRHIRGGKEGAKKRPWTPSAYQFQHIRRIVGIHGGILTLDVMLPQSFQAEHGGGEVFQITTDELATHCGVENLSVVSNYDPNIRGNQKDTDFRNLTNGIFVEGLRHGWVRDCTVKHVSLAAIKVGDDTRHVTVRDCRSLQPVGPVTGGKRYPFYISGGSLHLFYGCHSEDGRHDFVGGSRTMGPFAFVRCTALRGGQSEPHHRWGCGYLFDHVTTRDGSIAAINRGDSGSGHGWAAANTLIWNGDAESILVFDPETVGENNFAIGFRGRPDSSHDTRSLIHANTRAGYWGTPHEGAYFGHALMGNGHIESPDRPVLPESLFEQQLIDRIGAARAAAVLEARRGE
jgi:hypothetical protein